MKKLFLFSLLFLSATAFAQFNEFPGQQKGNLMGGFGLTWIDGQPNYAFRVRPDISYKNFGIGLDLNLEFDANGNLRKENFNTTSDYLAIIRYLRYGYKNDDVYVQAGAIDNYTLGHGSIMYEYNNSPSVDNKKIGLVFDLNMEKWGFESIYSDFSTSGVAGGRLHFNPFKFTSLSNIWLLSNLEIGATFAGDFNDKAGVEAGIINPTTSAFTALVDNGSLSTFGFDLGLPLFKSSFTSLELYADYAKIVNFGDGISSGLLFKFNGAGLLNASLKFERRWNSSQYIPSYFGALYELERFSATYNASNHATTVASRINALRGITDSQNGFFGALTLDVMHYVNILGGYQRLDKLPQSGILNLRGEVAPTDAPYVVRAGYDKVNIIDETDMFKLDDRSTFYAELGYKPYSYLLVSMVYQWTFTPIRDNDKNIIAFAPQKKVEPRISFIYPFNVGH
jgi:hypothetical protein